MKIQISSICEIESEYILGSYIKYEMINVQLAP